MVEVYGKKALQIYAQDPGHRCAYTWVNAQRSQCKESKERSEGKERKKIFTSPRVGNRTHNPHLKSKAPVCSASFTLHKYLWLQLLYEYQEGCILNSIAQYSIHV